MPRDFVFCFHILWIAIYALKYVANPETLLNNSQFHSVICYVLCCPFMCHAIDPLSQHVEHVTSNNAFLSITQYIGVRFDRAKLMSNTL